MGCQKKDDRDPFWITIHEEEEIFVDLVNIGLKPEQVCGLSLEVRQRRDP
jgi:hypothetical protein